MVKQFLRELNRELRPLNKEERKKCLSNYEEIILDKIENGITEENAVNELGNVKSLAREILSSYIESEGKVLYNLMYFNRMYILFDIVILVISYLLAYYLTFEIFSTGVNSALFSVYIAALIYIILCFLIPYFMLKLYSIKCVQNKLRETWTILKANVIGVIAVTLILYLTGLSQFSRAMLLLFVCVNIIIQIVTRNFIINRVGNL